MGSLFLWLLRLFSRFLLSLRYRVVLNGLDRIEAGRGMLILPNHPAEIDPVLLEVLLWTKLHPRPVVVEDFFHAPGLHGLLSLMRALPIPNIESGRSAFKTRRIDSSLGAIIDGVQRGDSFLIYPAGALQRADRQTIGGASAVHALVQRMPDVPVLLVRTKGLWGSSFSWIARNGRPNLGACLLHGAWVLLANGLFFAPRRTVEIEVAPAPADFPRAADRTSFNRWLDAWYFPQGDVQPIATRYYRWSRKRPKLAGVRKHAAADIADVPEPIRQGVLEEFARMRSCRPDQITPEMDLRRDLGLDSLEMTDVFFWLDARFGVSDVTLPELTTVGATMLLAHGRAHAAGDIGVSAAPRLWRTSTRRPALVPIDGATLPEAFLRSCDRMGSSVACADDIAGVITYKRLKLAALALARAIRDLPGDRIGIMLPASVGASVTFFATLLAGKTPVMINWTLGARNIRHVIDVSGIKAILTSLAFVDNVDTLPVDEIEPLLVFLEHVRRDKIKWRAKLAALFAATRSADRLLASLGLDRISPDAPAFVLFTSGSESVPKGVPLTHANILANIRASIEALQFDKYETVL